MGAFSGSISVTKFFVHGELPEELRTAFMRRIKLRAFRPLVVEEDADERYGWCVMGEPLDGVLGHETVFYNSYVNLGFRLDRWRFPKAVLKAELARAEQERLAALDRERLSRAEKQELRDRIKIALKRKALPSMQHFDFSWNLETGEAFFWSQTPSIHERLTELFELTFKLELVASSPWIAAVELELGPRAEDALGRVQPTALHTAKLLALPEGSGTSSKVGED